MSVYRSNSERSRKFWEGVDQSAAEVATWPDWKIDRPRELGDDDAECRTNEEANAESALR
jgi:hypothetical protein